MDVLALNEEKISVNLSENVALYSTIFGYLKAKN